MGHVIDMKKPEACSQKPVVEHKNAFRISAAGYQLPATSSSGMTLIETLVAITILTVAIVAPMSLAMQSLAASYYARDQITASNLAQEAIESVRAVRDGNILTMAYSPDTTCNGAPMTLLCSIPVPSRFTIDTRNNAMTSCPAGGECPPLQSDGSVYGYRQSELGDGFEWTDTRYTRSVEANFVEGANEQEIAIIVTVTWDAGIGENRSIKIYENLYRWVEDGSI